MSPRSLLSSLLLAGVAATFPTAPNPAQAQGLIDFLWGGSSEWGGGRQVVRFNPKYTPGQIIVSFGDRRLYLITRTGRAVSYPIAVPREDARWQGTTKISAKKINPSWRPTPEMLHTNPKLPHWVPGGHPMNPLGVRALYLGTSTYRIHGTDAPWTIGQAVSQGCIRMYNKDVLDLFPRVPVGTRVTVTWERFADQTSVASDYDDDAPPYGLTERVSTPQRHTIRNLPPLPRRSAHEAETAGLPQDFIPADDDTTSAAAKKPRKAHKVTHAKTPVKKPETAKKPKMAKRTETAKKPEMAKTPEPAKKAKVAKKPEAPKKPAAARTYVPDPAAAASASSAVEMARKAAEAARKAAAAARKAAEAAKKAAAIARTVAPASGAAKKPAKTEPGKHAAL